MKKISCLVIVLFLFGCATSNPVTSKKSDTLKLSGWEKTNKTVYINVQKTNIVDTEGFSYSLYQSFSKNKIKTASKRSEADYILDVTVLYFNFANTALLNNKELLSSGYLGLVSADEDNVRVHSRDSKEFIAVVDVQIKENVASKQSAYTTRIVATSQPLEELKSVVTNDVRGKVAEDIASIFGDFN